MFLLSFDIFLPALSASTDKFVVFIINRSVQNIYQFCMRTFLFASNAHTILEHMSRISNNVRLHTLSASADQLMLIFIVFIIKNIHKCFVNASIKSAINTSTIQELMCNVSNIRLRTSYALSNLPVLLIAEFINRNHCLFRMQTIIRTNGAMSINIGMRF